MSFDFRRLSACLVAGLLVAPCGTATTAPSPSAVASPSPSPVASATPQPTASTSPTGEAYVATFSVEDEQYRVLLTDPADVAVARRLLAGEEAPTIPNGLIVRGESGVNTGHTWHIAPESVEFADMTMEVCDGLPSHIDDGTLEGERYCPWGAELIDLQPAD